MPHPIQRVFIADDSPTVRESLGDLVSKVPNITLVGEASCAQSAIEDIRRLQPDLVILDISMPAGSGMHVLETTKREYPAITVVMLTNFPYDAYREKCASLGADYFFDKSTEFNEVLSILRQAA